MGVLTVGVVFGVLGSSVVLIGAGYYVNMKYNNRRYSGYASLGPW